MVSLSGSLAPSIISFYGSGQLIRSSARWLFRSLANRTDMTPLIWQKREKLHPSFCLLGPMSQRPTVAEQFLDIKQTSLKRILMWPISSVAISFSSICSKARIQLFSPKALCCSGGISSIQSFTPKPLFLFFRNKMDTRRCARAVL